jgi:GTP-binding protein Era
VERESQKGIIIGQGGTALKRVGTEARLDAEEFFGKKIFLELYVKVAKEWREKESSLRRFGYTEE